MLRSCEYASSLFCPHLHTLLSLFSIILCHWFLSRKWFGCAFLVVSVCTALSMLVALSSIFSAGHYSCILYSAYLLNMYYLNHLNPLPRVHKQKKIRRVKGTKQKCWQWAKIASSDESVSVIHEMRMWTVQTEHWQKNIKTTKRTSFLEWCFLANSVQAFIMNI